MCLILRALRWKIRGAEFIFPPNQGRFPPDRMLSFFIEENYPVRSDFNKKIRFASLTKGIFLVGLICSVTFLDLFLLVYIFHFKSTCFATIFYLFLTTELQEIQQQKWMKIDTTIKFDPRKFMMNSFSPGWAFINSPGGCFLRDHPSYSNNKWVGSPLCISHDSRPIWKEGKKNLILRA